MPRRTRKDYPGAFHHLTNRGLAHRTICETPEDFAYLESLLAEVARRCMLEIHAFSLLHTHYHILARSPLGALPAAMQWLGEKHAVYFNRTRGRDGPLFRGRYRSKIIESDIYFGSVLCYVDGNAVTARLVDRPFDYQYGSARYYIEGGGPAWLTKSVVEDYVREAFGADKFRPADYEELLTSVTWASASNLVERRMDQRGRQVDQLDDLVHAPPGYVREWMRANAHLADGRSQGVVLVHPRTIRARLLENRAADPHRELALPGIRIAFWDICEAGLLRSFCGLRLEEIGESLGFSVSTAHKRCQIHARALTQVPGYAEATADIVAQALATEHAFAKKGVGFVFSRT